MGILSKYIENNDGGEVVKKTDSKLRSQSKRIACEYDGLGRLTRNDYPARLEIPYVYGTDTSRNSLAPNTEATNEQVYSRKLKNCIQ